LRCSAIDNHNPKKTQKSDINSAPMSLIKTSYFTLKWDRKKRLFSVRNPKNKSEDPKKWIENALKWFNLLRRSNIKHRKNKIQ
jgi:hypothetical protein